MFCDVFPQPDWRSPRCVWSWPWHSPEAAVASHQPVAPSTDRWQSPVLRNARRASLRAHDGFLRERIRRPVLTAPFPRACPVERVRRSPSRASYVLRTQTLTQHRCHARSAVRLNSAPGADIDDPEQRGDIVTDKLQHGPTKPEPNPIPPSPSPAPPPHPVPTPPTPEPQPPVPTAGHRPPEPPIEPIA
jgi:hypothetical protein